MRSTAEIGAFVITRETSSSQGVRRIEALTSAAALEHLRHEAAEAAELRAAGGRARGGAPARAARRRRAAVGRTARDAGLIDGASEESGVWIVADVVEGADADELLQLSDRVRAKLSPAAAVLGGNAGGKAHLLASFDPAVQAAGSRPSTSSARSRRSSRAGAAAGRRSRAPAARTRRSSTRR